VDRRDVLRDRGGHIAALGEPLSIRKAVGIGLAVVAMIVANH